MATTDKRIETTKLELSTVAGIITAISLVVLAAYFSGSVGSFLDLPAILIVIGGTFAITTACFTVNEIWRAQALMLRTVLYKQYQVTGAAEYMLDLANRARKSNVLALQNVIATGKTDAFLDKGLSMVVDGVQVERIDYLMRQDMHSLIERHNRGIAVFRKSAEIAPAMGLIGTLIGLVQMLSRLDDPSAIGPAMSIALLTTLYGAMLSYMVFTPLASKLERNTSEEILVNQIYLEGVLSIAKQENPRQLETVMNTILPPAKRIRFFS